MKTDDCDLEAVEEAGRCPEELTAAAGNSELNNIFDILAQAELEHHDALVELTGKVGPQKRQLRLLQGGACLLKTSPGKA
jgi:rubrerythrin